MNQKVGSLRRTLDKRHEVVQKLSDLETDERELLRRLEKIHQKEQRAEQRRQEQARRQEQQRQDRDRTAREANQAAEEARAVEILRTRQHFLSVWDREKGPWRERLNLLAELSLDADVSPFEGIAFSRSPQKYWARLSIHRAFADSEQALKAGEIRVELGRVYGAMSSTLKVRYPLESFRQDMDVLLGGHMVISKPVAPANNTPYELIVPEGADTSLVSYGSLQNSEYRLPYHFAEVLFAVGVHQRAVNEYERVRVRSPELVEAILPPDVFEQLATQILTDWRSPMLPATKIDGLLAKVDDLAPTILEPADPRDEPALRRRRSNAVHAFRVHFMEREAVLNGEYSLEDLEDFIATELTEDLTLGELQRRIDRHQVEIDNRVHRQAVIRFFEDHSDQLAPYYPQDKFDAELDQISTELPRAIFRAEIDQLGDRVAEFVRVSKNAYSQRQEDDRVRKQIEVELQEYEQWKDSIRNQHLTRLQRRRGPHDSDADIENQLNAAMANWETENPPPVALEEI